MHISRHIAYWAGLRGDQVALEYAGKSITWSELDRLADAVAANYLGQGVVRGDRIGCLLPNCLEWCVAYVAAIKVGAIFVPLNAMFGSRELRHIESDAGCKVVVSTKELIPKLGAGYTKAQPEGVAVYSRENDAFRPVVMDVSGIDVAGPAVVTGLSEDDPVAICYTSGTTGLPKGAVQTHHSVSAMCTGLMLGYGMHDKEVFYLAAPLAFTGGIICNLTVTLFIGAKLILNDRYDPVESLQILASNKVTAFGGATIFWQKLTEVDGFAEADLSRLRHGFCGGAPVTPDLINIFLDKGVGIRQSYGCTEAGGGATLPDLRTAATNPRSCGTAMIGLALEVRSDGGQVCEPGEVGEICVKGPQLMKGYWGKPDLTAAAIIDGWFHTGDLAFLEEDGGVVIVDRKKNMIISGGVNVYPAEVEATIESLESVAEAVVMGVPSDKWGEEVVAIVMPKGRSDEEGLKQDLVPLLGKYKTPKSIRFTSEPLPRTATGKINRQALSDLYASLAG